MFFEFIFLVILIVTFLLLCLWVLSGYFSKSLFTEIPYSSLEPLREELQLKNGDIFCHLGCGDGRVLFYLSDQNLDVQYVGIEDNLFSYWVASIHNKWNKVIGKKTIKIIYKNLMEKDLSFATHIFSYLPPQIIDDILPRLDEELRPKTKLFSLSFKFTLKKPTKEISFNNKNYKRLRKIFVYEF